MAFKDVFFTICLGLSSMLLSAQEGNGETASTVKEMTFATLSDMYVAKICAQTLIESYQRLGITVHIVQFPAKRSLTISNSGLVDGEVVRIKGAEKNYMNLQRVKSQICFTESRAYVKNKKIEFIGWQSLRPYKIGVIRGHLYALKGTQGMDVVIVKSNEILFRMLDRGRIDVAIAQVADALTMIDKLRLKGVDGLDPILLSMPLYHYLHKKNLALLPEIEKVIDEMAKEGRLAAIHDDFINKLKKRALISELDTYDDLSKPSFYEP